MISSTKESIYIQSPYFIPDQAFLDSIKIAALGGVDVNIMVLTNVIIPLFIGLRLKRSVFT